MHLSPVPGEAASLRCVGLKEDFGKAIKRLRKERHWTQVRLAEESKVGRAGLVKHEKGTQIAGIDTIEAYLTALGCDLWDLARAIDEVQGRDPRFVERDSGAVSAEDLDAKVQAAVENALAKEYERIHAYMDRVDRKYSVLGLLDWLRGRSGD